MSNILSYNDKTNKPTSEDWVQIEPYSNDDIARIKDPNGGLAENPRTAIPSPFAQLDLVKNAFEHLSDRRLQAGLMDQRLVSNALDVAQLFFNFENHKDYLHIVRWNRTEQIEQLLSNPAHRLYGETLDLFLRADTAYNFHLLDDWFIILWDNVVIGATSPSSLVMGAPGLGTIDAIKVEQGVPLFSKVRQLWQRDDDFVCYLFTLFNAYPSLREHVGVVYSYMLANLDLIKREKPELYKRIITLIPNPSAFDSYAASSLVEKLELMYEPFPADSAVCLLGAKFYRKRSGAIKANAADSDFVINPSRKQNDGTVLPLVLRSGFNGRVDQFRYIDKVWDSSTEVLAGGVPVERRKLPDTSIEYPFLTTDDFFMPEIVQLGNEIDADHFFNGNLRTHSVECNKGYLLPLKPIFFRYFNVEQLAGNVCGSPMLTMVETAEGGVTVTLRVPLKKRFIELSRTYQPVNDDGWTFDERRGTGRVVGAHLSASVFPFVRTGSQDSYTVQLFSMIANGDCSLRFFRNGGTEQGLTVNSGVRTRQAYITSYYDVDGTFDYVEATVNTQLGSVTGVIVPLWAPYTPSNKELIFAVDFGTTNSHVEWAERGRNSEPLTFADGKEQVLVASLIKEGSLDIADQLMRIEFLPRNIDSLYGFPLRTALASNAVGNTGTTLFTNVNIPFLYERRYFAGYDVTTGLKWMGDTTLSQEFLREIMLLIKAKALIENADLSRTEVVYFFPVSMGGSDRRKLADVWTELYNTYMGGDADNNLRVYPESIAPAYFYSGASVAGSSYASIDIGGGTSDVVVYQPSADRLKSVPTIISSFRFAGNAIFGDGFSRNDADNNPLLSHYSEYFKKLIDRNENVSYLNSILSDVMKSKRSEDINAFLFSIVNVEELQQMREIDRKLYSYNALLRNDEHRKLIFLYFYAAIIYYVAQMMHSRNLIKPKQIYFSGTGSKILNILGSLQEIEQFTRDIIERVYGESYAEHFEIKIEKDQPKQITCRGGIRLENARLDGEADCDLYSPRSVNKMKYCYSMVGTEPLTMEQANDIEVRDKIVESVEQFNDFFLSLCDADMRDEFGIDKKVLSAFTSVLGRDLPNYLTSGINSYLRGRYEGNDVIEDVPFFYPIIGAIRHNLINELCHSVLSKLNE